MKFWCNLVPDIQENIVELLNIRIVHASCDIFISLRDASSCCDVALIVYDALPASAISLRYQALVQVPSQGLARTIWMEMSASKVSFPQFCVYYLWLTFMSFLMIPLSLARPCSVTNAVLGAKLMIPLSSLLGLDWKVESMHYSHLLILLRRTNRISETSKHLWISFIIQVRGETDLLQRPEACVVVANHQSSIDLLGMFVIWGKLKRVAALAKQSLMYYGSFGITAFLCGTVFVDRLQYCDTFQ